MLNRIVFVIAAAVFVVLSAPLYEQESATAAAKNLATKKECRLVCDLGISSCENTCGEFGTSKNFRRTCKKAVLKRCRKEGVGFCQGLASPPITSTTLPASTTTMLPATSTTSTSTTTLQLCGNGMLDGDEQCDDLDLGGMTCEDLGFTLGGTLGCTAACQYELNGCQCADTTFPASGQTTCWAGNGSPIGCDGTGQDGELQAGAPITYVDNGDGTITDLNTGLMWEKKSDDDSINDVDNTYTWDEAFSVHVAGLNAEPAFAGYNDWRVPNVRELQSIVDYGVSTFIDTAVDPAFDHDCAAGCTVTECSCTAITNAPPFPPDYWTSTSNPATPKWVWTVHFHLGPFVSGRLKASTTGETYYVRAVRGGQ